jgi:hypothetical protein
MFNSTLLNFVPRLLFLPQQLLLLLLKLLDVKLIGIQINLPLVLFLIDLIL